MSYQISGPDSLRTKNEGGLWDARGRRVDERGRADDPSRRFVLNEAASRTSGERVECGDFLRAYARRSRRFSSNYRVQITPAAASSSKRSRRFLPERNRSTSSKPAKYSSVAVRPVSDTVAVWRFESRTPSSSMSSASSWA
jgi:hypothetical protein